MISRSTSPFHSSFSPYRNGASKVGSGRKEFDDYIQNLNSNKQGPESGMAIPHAISLQAVVGTAFRTYWHGQYDEALRDSQENADAMRNDPFLRGLVNQNKRAVCSLKCSIEVDNERDPWEKALKDGLTQIWKTTPYSYRLNWYMLEALWYGRYAGQFTYHYRNLNLPALPKGGGMAGHPFLPGGAAQLGGPALDAAHQIGTPATGPMGSLAGLSNPGSDREKRKALCIKWHIPYEGDKIGYDYDGCPYLLVSVMAAAKLQDQGGDIGNIPNIHAKSYEYGYTTAGGKALFLRSRSWRERFAIHTDEVLDSPFLDAEKGDQIHGIGIRSVIYWYWWLRDEFLSNITDWCARTGLGVRLWYYDASNPASEAAVDQAARDQSDKVNIKIPRTPGSDSQEGVEFVDTSGSGADLLLRIVEHVEDQIEFYITGRRKSEQSSGLGGGSATEKRDSQTSFQITKRNAANLSDTYTYDILDVLKRYSFPEEMQEIPARLVFHADSPDPKEFLDAAKTFVDMGGTVREDEARAVLGFASPHEGERVLGGQQPLPPGVGGGGIDAGDGKEFGGKNDAPNERNGENLPNRGPGVQQKPGIGIFEGDGQVSPADNPLKRIYEKGRYEAKDGKWKDLPPGGHWRTFGSNENGKGGCHVYIYKNRILVGPRNLKGRSFKDGKLGKQSSFEGHPLFINEDRHSGSIAAAKESGIDPMQLHTLAHQVMEKHDEHVSDINDMLAETRASARKQGINLHHSNPAFARGDYANIVGFDLLARQMASKYPQYLGAHGYEQDKNYDADEQEASEKLFDYLKEGSLKNISEEQAYQEALEEILAHKDDKIEEPSDADEGFAGDVGDFNPAEFDAPAAAPASQPAPAPPSAEPPAKPAPASNAAATKLLGTLKPGKEFPQVAEVAAAKAGAALGSEQWQEYSQVATVALGELAMKRPDMTPEEFGKLSHKVAANAIRYAIRPNRSGVKKKTSALPQDMDVEGGADRAPDILATEERDRGIHEVIATLPPREQEVAKGFLAGEKATDIAKRLGLDRSAISRIMPKLVAAFEKHNYGKELAEKIRYEHEHYIHGPILPEVMDEILEQSKAYGPRGPDFIRACMEAMNGTESQWEAIMLGRKAFSEHGSQRYAAASFCDVYAEHSTAPGATDRLRYAREAVDGLLANMEKERTERERYEAETRRKAELQRIEATERKHTQLLEAIPTIIEKAKPEPMPLDLEAFARLIREMPPPNITVNVPEQKALDLEAFAKIIKDLIPPPAPTGKTVNIKKTKDGFTANVQAE